MSAQLIESSPVEPLVVGVQLYPGDTWFREIHVRSLTTQLPVDLSAWAFEARLGDAVGVVDASRAAEGRLAVTFTPEQTAAAAWGDVLTVAGTLAGGRRTFLHGAVGATAGSSIPVGPAQRTRVVSSDVDLSVYAAPRGDKGADGNAVSVALVQRAEGAEGRAVAAADDAEGYAGQARTDAGLATAAAAAADTSADEAAEHERVSLAAAQGIVAARDAAAASAGEANGHAGRAGTSAFNAGQSATAAQSSEEDAGGFAAAAKGHRDAAEGFKATAEGARDGAVAARDLALAGQFAGSGLSGTVNLNDVRTPGVYYQSNSGSATLANNYPVASGLGVLTVGSTNNTVTHRYQITTGGSAGRIEFVRRYIVSAALWTPWSTLASQRVDQTAGRAIYTWDDVNGREQLIYGDTGWRSLATADLMSGWKISGHVRIRRINNMVFFRMSGIDGSEATADSIYQLPAGFRPEAQNRALPAVDNLTPISIRFPSTGQILMPSRTIALTAYAAEFGPILTADPWPTTLPGAASGGIPNA